MQKKTKKKQKRRWTMEFKNETQTEKFMCLSFVRNRSSFFLCVCVLCVCFGWTFCRFLVRVYIEKKESYVPPENVGTRWDVTTFFTKASSFYASSSSSFLRFWTFPPRFSRRLRRSRRRRGAKRPRRRRERVLAPFREVRRRF